MKNEFLTFLESQEQQYWDNYLILQNHHGVLSDNEHLFSAKVRWYESTKILEQYRINHNQEINEITKASFRDLTDSEFVESFLNELNQCDGLRVQFGNVLITSNLNLINEWRNLPHWNQYYDSFEFGDITLETLKAFIFGMFAQWCKETNQIQTINLSKN